MSKFKQQLDEAEKKINDAIEKTIRGATLEMFGEIVRRTPVGNTKVWKTKYPPKGYVGGRLRGNWQASINNPKLDEPDVLDSSGVGTITKAESVLKRFDVTDKSIWFSNNLPYAQKIEDGWSTQRPTGMVKTTVKMFKPLMAKMARINIV